MKKIAPKSTKYAQIANSLNFPWATFARTIDRDLLAHQSRNTIGKVKEKKKDRKLSLNFSAQSSLGHENRFSIQTPRKTLRSVRMSLRFPGTNGQHREGDWIEPASQQASQSSGPLHGNFRMLIFASSSAGRFERSGLVWLFFSTVSALSHKDWLWRIGTELFGKDMFC